MITFTQTVTVTEDGRLILNAPAQLRGKTVEAVLVAQPVMESNQETDANGYPLVFLRGLLAVSLIQPFNTVPNRNPK